MSVKVKNLKNGKFKVTMGKGDSDVKDLNSEELILFAAARGWRPNKNASKKEIRLDRL